MRNVAGTALLIALSLPASEAVLAGEKPWDAMPQRKCSEIVTEGGEFTPLTEGFLTWLVGYIDGLKAASVLDKRLKTLSDAGSLQVGPLVLALCAKKRDDTVIGAATGVAELLINAQSGRVLNLNWR